jgi:hypothetical protein
MRTREADVAVFSTFFRPLRADRRLRLVKWTIFTCLGLLCTSLRALEIGKELCLDGSPKVVLAPYCLVGDRKFCPLASSQGSFARLLSTLLSSDCADRPAPLP